jgi:hypothetical protein
MAYRTAPRWRTTKRWSRSCSIARTYFRGWRGFADAAANSGLRYTPSEQLLPVELLQTAHRVTANNACAISKAAPKYLGVEVPQEVWPTGQGIIPFRNTIHAPKPAFEEGQAPK